MTDSAAMTPKTQSVCVCPGKKHPGRIYCLICLLPYEPVAEPASTGEQPPDSVKLVGTRQPTEAEIEYGKALDPMAKECLERNKAKMERAARPSEPSAPKTGYCPYHGEKLVPIFGGQWNGCPKCPRDADGFTNTAPQTSAEEWKKQCLGVGTCRCVGRCQFAPSPTPSVSTEQEQSALELHRAANKFGARVKERNPSWFTEECGSTDFAEARDRLTAALLNYANFAAKTINAPSVAGTQPTPDNENRHGEHIVELCSAISHLIGLCEERGLADGKHWQIPHAQTISSRIQQEYFGYPGAAQGTPQVEEKK